MILSATWGLGSAIAQGEVTPDRYELTREGALLSVTPGRKDHQVGCIHTHPVPAAMVSEPCLSESQALQLGALLCRVQQIMDMPVEIEWAMDDSGFQLLQARPLHVQPAATPNAVWQNRPRLNGHAAGVGWGEGRACVIQCECELSRVSPGDILVTKVAGPALSHILTRVAGVVAERGGSTSHMASLARERGIPMVLGVLDATQRIPDGSTVAVDGVAGVGEVDEQLMATKIVAVTDSVFPNLDPASAVLAKIGAEIRLAKEAKPEAILDVAREADAVLTTYAKITGDMIPQLTRCRVIGRFGIGVDNVDIPAATSAGIVVTRVPDYCLDEVSDHTMALLLSLVRKIPSSNARTHSGRWEMRAVVPIHRLRGTVLGLVAFGQIPQLVAPKAQAFGIRVRS